MLHFQLHGEFFIQISSLPASTASTYSASMVDKATDFYNLEFHDTAPPYIGHHIPEVDRLESASPDMSELVNPSSTDFSTPNLRHTLEVHFKYLSIHLTTAQCSRPGLLIYWLTTPTTKGMSDLVQTIAYIKLPTTEAQNTFLISAFTFPLFGHYLAFSLHFVGNAEPIDFAFDMLNVSKIFVTYFSCDNHNTFLVLSRTMCIPKICLAGPRSFMANDLPMLSSSSRSSSYLV